MSSLFYYECQLNKAFVKCWFKWNQKIKFILNESKVGLILVNSSHNYHGWIVLLLLGRVLKTGSAVLSSLWPKLWTSVAKFLSLFSKDLQKNYLKYYVTNYRLQLTWSFGSYCSLVAFVDRSVFDFQLGVRHFGPQGHTNCCPVSAYWQDVHLPPGHWWI